MAKKNKKTYKIPTNVASLIPYSSVCKTENMIELEAGVFSKTFSINDNSFVFSSERKTEIINTFIKLINSIDNTIDFQFSFNQLDKETLKYITLSLNANSIEEAKKRFLDVYESMVVYFKELDIEIEELTLIEQLRLIHSIYHANTGKNFDDKLDGQGFTPAYLKKAKLTSKDIIGPDSIKFEKDHIVVDGSYIRVLFINSFSNHLTNGFLNTFLKSKAPIISTIHYKAVDAENVLATIEKEINDLKASTVKKNNKTKSNKKDKKKKETEVPKSFNREELSIKESYTALFKDAVEKQEKVYQLSFCIALFASSLEELDKNTEKLVSPGTKFFYKVMSLDFQQKKGLTAILPLASNPLSIARTFSSRSAALFFPFNLGKVKLNLEEVNEVETSQEYYILPSQNKTKSKSKGNKNTVKNSIQDTIPYLAAYTDNGIIETSSGVFSKAYTFQDINYHTATEENQQSFLLKYGQLINRFDPSIKFQIVLNNRNVDMKDFKKNNLLPMKKDNLDVFRQEYNQIILKKMEEGRNNLVKERYLVLSTECESIDVAENTFNRLDAEIINAFKEIGGSRAEAMTTPERLELLYDIYNIGNEGNFLAEMMAEKGVVTSTDLEALQKMGVSTKDLIAPSGFEFKKDYFLMGDKFARVLYLVDLPNSISDKFMSDLTSASCNMVTSINLTSVPPDKAVKIVKHQMVNINANMQEAQKNASKAGYSIDLISADLKQAQEEANDLLQDLTGRSQKMFLMTFTVMIISDTLDQLDTDTEIIQSIGRKHLCNIKKLNFQQESGLNTTLPLALNELSIKRTLTTESTIIFSPFDTQELIQKEGMYYGQNASSHNLILFNRKNADNGNGWILGTPGCVDRNTEFFNGEEWKSIADYEAGEKVLQFNTDTNEASLVLPERYIKAPCDKMYHFETKYGIDQTLSEEHRVIYYKRYPRTNTYSPAMEMSAAELTALQNKGEFRGKFKTDFKYNGKGIDLTDNEIKLMLAVICDGNFNKNNLNSLRCRINLKKERKIEALTKLLNEAGIEYTTTHTVNDYTVFSFNAPRREKEFLPYWYNCNAHQLQVICDNILQWDGRIDKKGRKAFSTTVKETADFVQFAFSACGYRAAISVNDRLGQPYMTNGKEYIRKSAEYTITISDNVMVGMEWHNDGRTNNVMVEEVIPSDGFKYCFTVPTHALVLRRNGKIFITGNSGKSFSAKREMANVFLNTDDDILIIDPEREYSPLVKAFGGEIIHIAPGSQYHLNPLDMDEKYGLKDDGTTENPIVLKADFILSLCETVIGGRYGLTPSQRTIIDRCVHQVYQEYIQDFDKSKTPTLLQFQRVLESQPEREAKEIALAFEIYTKGSLDVFAHQSNVDTNNRFLVYDIKDIGTNIKTMAYLIVLDSIWNRVIRNRKLGRRTWIYIDEVYILFEREESTNFIRQIFSRCRKWGGLITCITQNVEPILQNTIATSMLSNSAFIQLLNQAPVDRDILANLLHISPTQVGYINNAPAGQGVLYIQGTGIIPFRDNFNKAIAPTLYSVLTSKPSELKEEFR